MLLVRQAGAIAAHIEHGGAQPAKSKVRGRGRIRRRIDVAVCGQNLRQLHNACAGLGHGELNRGGVQHGGAKRCGARRSFGCAGCRLAQRLQHCLVRGSIFGNGAAGAAAQCLGLLQGGLHLRCHAGVLFAADGEARDHCEECCAHGHAVGSGRAARWCSRAGRQAVQKPGAAGGFRIISGHLYSVAARKLPCLQVRKICGGMHPQSFAAAQHG